MLSKRVAALSGAGALAMALGIAGMIAPQPAAANPYWAQQTGQSCSTCHFGGRETEGRAGLNPTGQAFLACGYHFAGPGGGCAGGATQGPQPQYSPAPYQPYQPQPYYQPPGYQQPAPPMPYQTSPYYYR